MLLPARQPLPCRKAARYQQPPLPLPPTGKVAAGCRFASLPPCWLPSPDEAFQDFMARQMSSSRHRRLSHSFGTADVLQSGPCKCFGKRKRHPSNSFDEADGDYIHAKAEFAVDIIDTRDCLKIEAALKGSKGHLEGGVNREQL